MTQVTHWICAALAAAAALASPEHSSAPAIVFRGVNLVPMTADDLVLEDQTVIVAGGEVAALGPNDRMEIPSGATVIEGAGRYLVPGLIDLHVHVFDERDFLLHLASGVTTVRNANGQSYHLAWREAIERGDLLGPTLVTTGPQLVGIEDAESAREEVASEALAGFDGLKLYDDLSAEVVLALAEAAREEGLAVGGHVPRNLKLDDVLAAKPDSIDHAEELLYSELLPALDPAALPPLAARLRGAGVALITTLTAFDHICRQVSDLDAELARGDLGRVSYLSRWRWERDRNTYRRFTAADVPVLRERLAFQYKMVKALHDGGVRIVLGTDAGGPPFVLPGISALDELDQLVACGLTPGQALAAGTREAACMLKDDALGTIDVGKRADLVLLAGNPLDAVANFRKLDGVMVRGRWHSRQDLDSRVEALVAAHAREETALRALLESGFEAGAKRFDADLALDPPRPPFPKWLCNELGYQLLKIDKRPDDAVVLFRINALAHPQDALLQDSLGDGLAGADRDEEAIVAYERALELDPALAETREKIETLRR